MLAALGKNALIFDVGPVLDHFGELPANDAEGVYWLRRMECVQKFRLACAAVTEMGHPTCDIPPFLRVQGLGHLNDLGEVDPSVTS